MTKEEKKILTTICMALPYMDEFSKGYLLAVAETKARDKKNKEKKEAELQECVKC